MSLASLEAFTQGPSFDLCNNPSRQVALSVPSYRQEQVAQRDYITIQVHIAGFDSRYLTPKLPLLTSTLYSFKLNVHYLFIIQSFKIYLLSSVMLCSGHCAKHWRHNEQKQTRFLLSLSLQSNGGTKTHKNAQL